MTNPFLILDIPGYPPCIFDCLDASHDSTHVSTLGEFILIPMAVSSNVGRLECSYSKQAKNLL